MKENALDYALETLKMYSDTSIHNPYNRAGNVMFESERLEWNRIFRDQKIITYLETILERLPYEPKVMTDENING
mgnify:CR=1 FL=1